MVSSSQLAQRAPRSHGRRTFRRGHRSSRKHGTKVLPKHGRIKRPIYWHRAQPSLLGFQHHARRRTSPRPTRLVQDPRVQHKQHQHKHFPCLDINDSFTLCKLHRLLQRHIRRQRGRRRIPNLIPAPRPPRTHPHPSRTSCFLPENRNGESKHHRPG